MTKNKGVKTAVPALRFPEFRDSDEWGEILLKCLLDYERPDNYIVLDTSYGNDGTPVLTANKSFILGYTQEEFGICDNLPVIIFDDFTVDKKYVDFPFKVKSSAIKILRPKIECNLRFVYELMNQIQFEAKEHKRYYISSYQNQIVFAPKLCEQTIIASCLRNLDDLIGAVGEKVDALKEYKKGLMQQLFPAEGKTIPALRFPEFHSDPEWEEKTLEEIGVVTTGNTPSTTDINNYGGNSLFVSPADISNERYVSRTKTTLSEKGFSQTRHIKANSILFVCIGSTIGKIAQNKVECATNQQINSLTPFTNNVADFVYSVLEFYAPKIASIAGNQAVPIINKTLFSSVSIKIPKEKEQRKIAKIFLIIDDLITAQNDRLQQLNAHKKGLMQQLFPKL